MPVGAVRAGGVRQERAEDHAEPAGHLDGHPLEVGVGLGVHLEVAEHVGVGAGRGAVSMAARQHLEAAVLDGGVVEEEDRRGRLLRRRAPSTQYGWS